MSPRVISGEPAPSSADTASTVSTRPFATHKILQELRQRGVIVQTVLLEGIETSCEYTPP
jgi:hypothetical protein